MSVCISPLVQAQILMSDESLSCSQCPKTFSNAKLLQQHQQMFHTDKLKPSNAQVEMDRAFICETCGKAFRFRSNLAEHRSVHTALKPYVCKFCGKSSRLKGNLTKHILKHHKKEQNDSIGKDDIIVKKAPKPNGTQFKENGGVTNGTPATATATATAITISGSPVTNGHGHNNNNNSTVSNNNNHHRSIKMELDDPDYPASPVKATAVAKAGTAQSPKKVLAKDTPSTTPPAQTIPSPVLEALESFLPKDVSTDSDRSYLISLGFDFGTTLSLSKAQELVAAACEMQLEEKGSPDTVGTEDEPDFAVESPPLTTNGYQPSTVGGEATLAALLAAASQCARDGDDGTPDSTDSTKGESPDGEESQASGQTTPDETEECPSPSPEPITRCSECGKRVRKESHLPIHMTLSHGFPPPHENTIEEKMAIAAQKEGEKQLQRELVKIARAIAELRAQQAAAPKVEQALEFMDGRVDRLERSLETALNSIYTLVQLQSGMTSSVNRLREDTQSNFRDMSGVIQSMNSRRISRRDSVPILDRERSRSPL